MKNLYLNFIIIRKLYVELILFKIFHNFIGLCGIKIEIK